MKPDTRRGEELLTDLITPLLVATEPEARQGLIGIDPEGSKEQLQKLDNWLARSKEHERIFAELITIRCQTGRLHECNTLVVGEWCDCASALKKALSLCPGVFRHFLNLVADRAYAEQLTKETYGRLLRVNRPQLTEIRYMGAYLLHLASRVAQEDAREGREEKSNTQSPIARSAWDVRRAIGVLVRLIGLK